MSTLSTVLAAILGVAFVAAAIPKLTAQAAIVANFERWGYAEQVRVTVGAVELLIGAFLLLGIALPALAVTGSLLVVFLMVGALATHQRASDPFGQWLPAAVLLVLDLVLAVSLLP
jgi:uncharacterized membrane protein YphA (DoxX/SURF4 family)